MVELVAHIIAHRGASKEEPENTLSAIRRAIEIGVDYIEIDVHLSADHTPVVIHDHTLCRTTDADKGKAVRHTHLQELKKFDAGSWFKGERTEERVPTLEEVLQLPLGKTGLMIEIKEDFHNDLSKIVMQLVQRYPHSKLLIGSFSPESLRYVIENFPNQPVMGLVEKVEEIEAFRNLDIRHLGIDAELLDHNKFKSLDLRSERIWAFTVDDHSVAERLIALGVEGIITNHPRSLKKIIKPVAKA